MVPLTPEADAVMVTVPPFLLCAIPDERTEAIFGFDDFQLRPARFPPELPSLNVPVAVNWMEVRAAILGFGGLIVIPIKCAVETVSAVEPLIFPKAAEIVLLPVATLVTTPVLATVAAGGFEEVHSTESETSCVLLSLNVAVAVNCFVVPVAMLELAGVTAIDISLAPVTVNDVLPVTDPLLAVIVVLPVPALVVSPLASTVATLLEEEDQVNAVNNCVLPSSKLPTALNCAVVPIAIEEFDGLTKIDNRCAGTTVSVLPSLNEPTVAVIVAVPAPTVAASPVPSTVATDVEEEVQATPQLRSALVPSV